MSPSKFKNEHPFGTGDMHVCQCLVSDRLRREAQGRSGAHKAQVPRPDPRQSPSPSRAALSGANRFRVQVICEKADRTDIPTIDKKKYLVPSDLTVYVLDPSLCLLAPPSLSLTIGRRSQRTICLRHPKAHQATS
jgi:hypothetical protein